MSVPYSHHKDESKRRRYLSFDSLEYEGSSMRRKRPQRLEKTSPTLTFCSSGPTGNAMSDLVLYEFHPPAVVITLNRADKRNALSRGLIASLGEALTRAAEDAA